MGYQLIRAGSLTLEYSEGKLRYIRLGNTELIRGIYFAVRNSEWGTLPLQVYQERLIKLKNGFVLNFRATSTEDSEAVVHWECAIQGDEDNRITFSLAGTFAREYASNRAGFCLLHPLKHLMGQPFEVKSPQGLLYNGSFPHLIAPHRPATDISSLTWQTTNGIDCRVRFEGEAFEMEDQRNWTDASFKTYCTPLKNNWPKTYRKGDTVGQRVVFEVLSSPTPDTPDAPVMHSVAYDTRIHFAWPAIGSRIPTGNLNGLTPEKLTALPLSTLRADLAWGGEAWEQSLRAVIDYARKCRKPLHLVLHYVQGDLPLLVNTLRQHCPDSALVAISVVAKDRIAPDLELARQVHPLLRTHFPKVNIGVGTQYLFAQFNRNRPRADAQADFVFFGNNPQVHAFDDQSILETIEGQGETVKSARAIAPQSPVYVSPIALSAPFSPDKLPKGTTLRQTLTYDFAPDPRQGSPFAAGWMLGCLATLAMQGASHLDFFETEGKRGLLIGQTVTPSLALLSRLLTREPIRLFFTKSSNQLKFSCLGIETPGIRYLYVANHSPESIRLVADEAWVAIAGLTLENGFYNFDRLDENRILRLLPYEIIEVQIVN